MKQFTIEINTKFSSRKCGVSNKYAKKSLSFVSFQVYYCPEHPWSFIVKMDHIDIIIQITDLWFIGLCSNMLYHRPIIITCSSFVKDTNAYTCISLRNPLGYRQLNYSG